MREYKPGDTFITKEDGYEFVAAHDESNGCERCIGRIHTRVCDMLPTGCGSDNVVWKPSNDAAKLLLVIFKLEGQL